MALRFFTTNTSRFTLSFFPPSYIEPGSDDRVYFHWLSFVDPARRTQDYGGIHTVHSSECRSLKAILERKAGCTEAARDVTK